MVRKKRSILIICFLIKTGQTYTYEDQRYFTEGILPVEPEVGFENHFPNPSLIIFLSLLPF